MIKQSLQIAGNQNIHRWTDGFVEITVPVINTGFQEISQNIIGIGRTNQLGHRQTHAHCIIACQNITKVASWHCKADFIPSLDFASLQQICIGTKVVNNLRYQAAPVNGVGRGQRYTSLIQFFVKFLVAENRLNTALSIIKITLYSSNSYIISLLSYHLETLNTANTIFWIENNYLGLVYIPEPLQGCFASITRGGNQNQNLILLPCFLQGSGQKLRQQLKGHILESAGRTMPKLQHRKIVHNIQRGYSLIVKFAVAIGSFYTAGNLFLSIVCQKAAENLYSPLLIA